MDGEVSAKDLEPFVKDVSKYNELLYNAFADGELGHNPFPG